MDGVKIVLAAVEEALARAWETFCGDASDDRGPRGTTADVSIRAQIDGLP
jgi:hypothetical protein